jgi:hypothetical protein
MARAPGAGNWRLWGRESHIPRYRLVELRSEDGKHRRVLELGGNHGIILAAVSAGAEICNMVVTHHSGIENFADISRITRAWACGV